jgi:glycosyltransferase involved in cell wall biosynthesis
MSADGRRPSLLVLSTTFPRDAADSTPSFVLSLCRLLCDRFDVTVLAPAVSGARDRDEIDGVRVRRFHYFWPRSLERLAEGALLENVRHARWLFLQAPFLLMFETIAAYRWARANRPSVIHAYWLIPQGIVAVLVGRLLGIPTVVTGLGGDVSGLRGWPWSAIRRAVISRTEASTVVSEDLRRRLGGVASKSGPPTVIPMGVDIAQLGSTAERPSDKSILFVGRLAEKKGLEYLLRALPDVLSRVPGATLTVVGDGPLRPDMEGLAGELGVRDSVRFAGGQPHSSLQEFYSSHRIFAMPSVVARSGDTEGMPVALLEAMVAGCSVVATSVGGIPEVVIPGRTGLLVEPRSPDALADAIVRLLASPETARRMGAVARRWIRRRFDWRSIAAAYGALLEKAAGISPADERETAASPSA